ncbi:alpha/beta hydrolase [Candidatus Poribacteria bacterium]
MRRFAFAIQFSVILLCLLLTCCGKHVPIPTPTGQIVTNTITSAALKDNKLGDPDTRDVVVYLPPGYAYSKKSHPVIYLLHGHGGDELSIVGELGEPLTVIVLDGLVKTGVLKKAIIVMPNANNKYGGSFYLNSELTGNYEDYIAVELVNYIDNKYRTIRDRSGRAIVGASMGGYGATVLSMKHPETYVVAASLSPPLSFDIISKPLIPEVIKENPDGMGGPVPDPEKRYTNYIYGLSAALSPNLDNPPFFVDLPFEYPNSQMIESVRQRWLKHDPLTMLPTYSSALRELKGIYIDVGDEDLPGFYPAAEAFHKKLTTMGIDHEYDVYRGGHSDRGVQRAVSALKYVSARLPDPIAP